jgi:hypothetical protein
MRIDFSQQMWFIEEDKEQAWRSVGYSTKRPFELRDNDVMWIWDQDSVGKKRNSVIVYNPPRDESDSKHLADQARIFDPKDSTFKEGWIRWKVDPTAQPLSAPPSTAATPSTVAASAMSRVRTAILQLIDEVKKTIPSGGLSSDEPAFQKYTGFNTARLKKDYWDVEKVPDKDHPGAMKDNPERDFTTCNAFLGNMMGKLGSKIGARVGHWLAKGPLQLNQVDLDVKGSWIPVDPTGVRQFRPGDIYSMIHEKNGFIQKFGHVGIVATIDATGWSSLDGGQGGRQAQKDYIKLAPRGAYKPTVITGWCDIDVYFAAANNQKQ